MVLTFERRIDAYSSPLRNLPLNASDSSSAMVRKTNPKMFI
ncbi:uncharacterized protein G2W53_030547 [Senna tora]|uniref:Uncharacterized protein n=1 Tax=Senna tora TaxID=362788 RepID=A0A834T656_9FABA|nr:uncharacterized protein G2W53_030547 [Senna tora]